MRRSALAFLALWISGTGFAQDPTPVSDIRVTTALHDDGSRTVTEIDSDSHSSVASTYNRANKLTRKVTFTLDEQNNPIQGIVYDGKGNELYKAVYKLNEMNRVSEETEFSTDNQLLGRFIYRYDANGRLLRIDAYDAQGNIVSQTGATSRKKQALPRRNQ